MQLECSCCVGYTVRWCQFCTSKENTLEMQMEAIVNYGKGRACFKIRRENPGIYYADLMYYDGNDKHNLPEKITLIRGIRYWTGSYNDPTLLNQLGKIIEESYNKISSLSTSSN